MVEWKDKEIKGYVENCQERRTNKIPDQTHNGFKLVGPNKWETPTLEDWQNETEYFSFRNISGRLVGYFCSDLQLDVWSF